METSIKPRAFNVRARTAQVREHHYSPANPDKPLWLVVPGAMVALAALGVILSLVCQTWYYKSMTVERGLTWILLLAPIYAAGVFCFSYGYELYDLGAAIRLTLIVVAVTVLAVVMVAVLLALLSNSKSSSKSTGTFHSGASSGSSLSGSRYNFHVGHSNDWASATSSPPTDTSGPVAPIPPPMAPLPMAMVCPACGQSFFLGLKTLFCPSCGVSLPPELLNSALPPRAPS